MLDLDVVECEPHCSKDASCTQMRVATIHSECCRKYSFETEESTLGVGLQPHSQWTVWASSPTGRGIRSGCGASGPTPSG